MAIIKLSGMVSRISGKIGGSIFGTSSNGSYIKNNSYSQQPQSPAQSIQRNKIYLTTQIWRTLTPAQRGAWSADTVNYPYVNRVGDVVYYNGFQLFNYLNANRLLIGETILLTPPSLATLGNPSISIQNATTSGIIIGVLANTLGNTIGVYATRGLPPNQRPIASDYRYIGHGGSLGGNFTFPITTPYLKIFPSLQIGQKLHCKFKTIVISSGETSDIGNNDSFLVMS